LYLQLNERKIVKGRLKGIMKGIFLNCGDWKWGYVRLFVDN
jgi:hypothetical protein